MLVVSESRNRFWCTERRWAMGFFVVRLKKNVLLPPRAFGPNLNMIVWARLRQEVRAEA